ncbi:MAG: hypothetical protein R3D84_07225 [Paracoccaceae bacterium]
MNFHWLMRMVRWARNPPSERQVIMVLSIIAFCLALAGIEWFWGWPDWLSVNSLRGGAPRF